MQKKIAVPLLVIAVAVAAAALLAGAREAPERRTPPELAPLVEVLTVESSTVSLRVSGHGTVRARHVVEIVPQVAGQVVEVDPSLVSGGTFRRGERLVAIDPRDYQLALRRSEAELARAEVQLETQRAEAVIARDEWGRLHPDEAPPSPLVLREPQIQQAEAELAAAEANVDRARLDLERTRIVAPFDGRVDSERVEVGQFVVAGQPVATIHGTDRLELPLPLEDSELAWFSMGAEATVSVRFAGSGHRWPARVVRIEGVDAASRMVTVVVEIETGPEDDPQSPDLRPGMFAEVEIGGRAVEGVPVPRSVLRDGDQLWLVDDEGLLRIREVEIARSDRDRALVTSGLEDGDRVVLTNLDAVTDGMTVRVADGGLS